MSESIGNDVIMYLIVQAYADGTGRLAADICTRGNPYAEREARTQLDRYREDAAELDNGRTYKVVEVRRLPTTDRMIASRTLDW